MDAWLEGECANKKQIAPASLDRFKGCFFDVRVAHGAEFRADGHAHGSACVRLAFSLDEFTWVRVESSEGDALFFVGPLHTGLAQIVEYHRQKVTWLGSRLSLRWFGDRQTPVRRQAFHGERPGYADDALILI